MYLRHTMRKKNGKTHVYWRLVRSVRHGRKVVQQTVAHLGELDAEGRARAQALAESITGRIEDRGQGDLFAGGVVGVEAVAGAQVRRALRRADAARTRGGGVGRGGGDPGHRSAV